jgi:serine phosphatase RsbU (regulator of sigma subunit)
MLAALVAYSLHDLIPAIASGGDGSPRRPEDLVSRLNERYKDFGERRAAPFFTIAYGTVDESSGEYSVARAGHCPVLHLSARGGARFVEAEGAAIGIFDSISPRPGTGLLEPGDRLLVASDGLLDAFGEDNLSEAKLGFASFAESRRDLGIDEFSEEFYSLDAERRKRQVLVDDSSLLVVERA